MERNLVAEYVEYVLCSWRHRPTQLPILANVAAIKTHGLTE
jgi:hypothetical protein